MKLLFLLSILSFFSLLGCRGCKPPEITGIAPGSGFARQIVQVQGRGLEFAGVLWDAGQPAQRPADCALFSARYVQIPPDAAPGNHTLQLRDPDGARSSFFPFSVRPLAGDWPAPRIEEVTVHTFIGKPTGKADLFLFISAANADARAIVTVNGILRPSVLYSAISSDFFNEHDAATFDYPVYHYAGLLVYVTGCTLGSTLQIGVQNTDNQRAVTNFPLPASAAELDSDNDGLPDLWEIEGYSAPGGARIDLAAMGCNPRRKDILVEVDWIAAARPQDGIWSDIESVFAHAPVLNPDGSAGISIHIDRGQGGAFTQGGQTLADHRTMDFGASSIPGYADFFACKKSNFDPARLPVFHYGIFGRARPNGSTGRGEIRGNDFMVTFASFDEWSSRAAQAGTFLHELGHNLGLRHGGIDNGAPDANETYKPNQKSSMNYNYQFSGITVKDGDLRASSPAVHSYSRGMYRVLDEQAIDEKAGICDRKPVDFNGDGRYSGRAAFNLNPSDRDTDRTDRFTDYNEWGNLHLNFRAAGSRWQNN